MATVTGMTADAINALVANFAENLVIDTGVLKYNKPDGSTVVVGNVPNQSAILNQVYPIGSIYMASVSTNPATLLGVGTWNAWGTGRVPVGFDGSQTEFNTSEKTGGEKTHVLTTAEMPSHTHTQASHVHSITHDHADASLNVTTISDVTAGNAAVRVTKVGTEGATPSGSSTSSTAINIPQFTGNSAGATATNNNTGGDTAHNNLQPYITCYMWKRVA